MLEIGMAGLFVNYNKIQAIFGDILKLFKFHTIFDLIHCFYSTEGQKNYKAKR